LHYNPRRVAVPTAFTPGATTNNLFRPINLQDYPGGEFWVWDRWGNLIFHSTGPTLLDYSWNGRYSNGQPCETGNYVWRVAIPGCPNNILNGAGGSQATNPFGNVLLIR
jgi:gliding motility-associated-like protein